MTDDEKNISLCHFVYMEECSIFCVAVGDGGMGRVGVDCVGAVAGRTDPSVGWTKKLISTTALLAAGIEFFIFQQGGTLIFHRKIS